MLTQTDVWDWINDKVSIFPYFQHFKGSFKGQHYDSAKVLNPSGASAKLASSEVMSVNNTWTDMNELKRYLCSFHLLINIRDLYQTDKQDHIVVL